MEFLKQSDEVLGVGEFSRRFKMLVKTRIPELWLKGEISNLKTYSSGHTYFTLKDDEGAISAVLGAFLVAFPTVRIKSVFVVLIFFPRPVVLSLPAWLVLGCWFLMQIFYSLNVFGGAVEVAGVVELLKFLLILPGEVGAAAAGQRQQRRQQNCSA